MPVTLLDDSCAVILRTRAGAYAFCWGDGAPDTPLRHLHWGPPVTDNDIRALTSRQPDVRIPTSTAARPRGSREEYPFWGGLRREEVALKLDMPDGVRNLDLVVEDVRLLPADITHTAHTGRPSHLDGEAVVVTMTDTHYPVRIQLTYRIDEAADAVIRSAAIINTGDQPLMVDQAGSASFAVPARPEPSVLTLSGMYGAESRVTRNPLPPGRLVLESRSGIPGHDAVPFVAIDQGATEDAGETWSVALAWSGSWKITTQLADDGGLHIVGGVNDFDLRHALPGGASLELPALVGIYSSAGWGGMTHRWHDYQRTILPLADRPRPVHYNSWEAAYYDVNADQQLELARVAADLGVELFVIDDGWFAGRTSDVAGLGDWTPDPQKFPGDAMRRLADSVHGLGMQFGLWVEPEMVNPDSDLFRAHPDWAYRWPTRERTIARHQLMLDFSRTDVQDWAIGMLDGLATDYALDYVKWDMNRPLAEPNSPSVADGGSVWIEHVRGLYRVWDEVRRRHPDLWLESCASGGGRADLGAIARTHWTWPSDNTDPLERLDIQAGYSMVNLPSTMSSWVTDSPGPLGRRTTPLRFRFHVAMSGLLAIGGDIRDWSPEDREVARDLVALYRDIRPLVQFGTLHRLDSPDPGHTDALAHVAENLDRAAVFVFAREVLHTTSAHRIRIRGLDPGADYRIRNTVTGDVAEFSGAFLAGHGVLVPLAGQFDSTILVLDRI